jgi:hypothetical protein
MAGTFKYALGAKVAIEASGEAGEVIGRAEYRHADNAYYILYKAADGRAVQAWWDESALVAAQ